MIGYTSTPDYYRDVIQHGWAKDAAAKAHKYIKRWKNKAGEWVYQYKKPKSNVSYGNWDDQRAWRSEGIYGREEHRKVARYSRFMRYKDIQKARNNAKLKAQGGGNVRDRGYSSSQGSGESKRLRNLGTRHSTRSVLNTTKDKVKIGRATATLDRKTRARDYNEWRKNPQRYKAKSDIENRNVWYRDSHDRKGDTPYKKSKKRRTK